MDSSLVLELSLATQAGRAARERLRATGEPLAAPHVLDLEVLQALRRLVRLRQVSPERALLAVEFLGEFPIARVPHEPHNRRIWQLRENMTAYDAAYIALAENHGAQLWTFDRKYVGAPGHKVHLEVF